MPSSEVEIDVVRGPRITMSLVVPLVVALAVLVFWVFWLLLLLTLLLLLLLLLLVVVTTLLLLLLLLPGGLLPMPLLLLLLTLLLALFGDVECPSSLSGGVVEPVLHEVLLLPELVPRMGSQPVVTEEEFGEQDRLISTRAAWHSSIGSSSLIL